MTLGGRRLLIPLTLGLLSGLVMPAARASTIMSGTLFFTTYQNQSGTVLPLTPDVWKVPFIYDSVAGLCLGSSTLPCPVGPIATTAIKTLRGADGIIFDPNDPTLKTLLIGEQNINQVAQLSTDGSILVEKKADGASACTVYTCGQAFAVQATPDKTKLLILPNDPGFGNTNVNVAPLNPLGDGVAHPVSGTDKTPRAVEFIGNTAYYGDALDFTTNGHFGTLDLSTFVTTRSTIVDDTGGGAGQGSLPSHALAFDSFTGCMILSSLNQIWQLCPDGLLPNTFHIKAKVSTSMSCSNPVPANIYCAAVNWDQTTVDGKGHLFAANNDGDLLFIDYSVSKLINTPVYQKGPLFLALALDDIIVATGANGCPATKGFWHDPDLHAWPNNSVTVGGVTYSGTTHSMTIGGKKYTQDQLLALMPTGGGARGNGFVITGSQLIAAVLNIANGAPHSVGVDNAIATVNGLLAVDGRMVGSAFGVGVNVNPAPANNTALIAAEPPLDAYNSSAASLGCVEGTPGS